MRTEITSGQTFDYLGFDLVMADNLPESSVLLADRGYDANSIWKNRPCLKTVLVMRPSGDPMHLRRGPVRCEPSGR